MDSVLHSISFDYDHYLSEEIFVIDDFGGICEDEDRIASPSTQHLCKDFDVELRHDNTPAGNIASNRCFEKEAPSLFSEMEYLTEVSPGTDVIISDMKTVAIAVNPTEFSCNRLGKNEIAPVDANDPSVPDYAKKSSTVISEIKDDGSPEERIYGYFKAPTDYQRILNNYIQKGRRKLEASSYSKMKAACFPRVKLNSASTSLKETVTIASSCSQGKATVPVQQSVLNIKHDDILPSRSITATKNRGNISHSNTSCIMQVFEPTHLFPSDPTRLQTSTESINATRLYRCQDCSSFFSSNELLRKHLCIITELYQCHLCLREFKKRKTLDHHMKSHDKVFSTNDDLRK
ncbi:uncharacterized protein LOC128727847 [Anopheles nili]|uniref:uncharacterized protein LOC128727847 n=1 Tax=Anopheles nili TaxID=185578 RepID=UPI00237A46F8|nr:uncharacterized protein LOC128727847 [Anopheles nili]